MFLGSYKVKFRQKNRIAFPAKFRGKTGDVLYLTNWFEESILILGKEQWELFTKSLMGENTFLLSEVRELERFIFGGTFEVTLDREGRFVLPSLLKEHARVEDEAVFVGGAWYISMWDSKRYENYQGINRVQIKDKAMQAYKLLKK